MIKRHLKIYIRDKGTLISSLVAIFVTIGLYLLFFRKLSRKYHRSVYWN